MRAISYPPEAYSTSVSYVVALEDRVERMEALLKRVSCVQLLHSVLPQHREDCPQRRGFA